MCERIQKDTGFTEKITPKRFRTTVLTDLYDKTRDIKKEYHILPILQETHGGQLIDLPLVAGASGGRAYHGGNDLEALCQGPWECGEVSGGDRERIHGLTPGEFAKGLQVHKAGTR